MKLYDLKLKEIDVLSKKIKNEKAKLMVTHGKKMSKTKKLSKKLIKQKKHVAKTVKNVIGQHTNLIVRIVISL